MRRVFLMTVLILFLLALVALVLTRTFPLVQALRIAFGVPFLLLAPGLAWSFVLVHEKVDWVTRIGTGFALSLAVVPVLLFLLNQFGVPITAWSVVGLTLTLSVGGVAVHLLSHPRRTVAKP